MSDKNNIPAFDRRGTKEVMEHFGRKGPTPKGAG
jgi:hypothetical protein